MLTITGNTKLKIVPLVLVCNDEYWLPYALKASANFFNRYIIYDVGSTDRTPDIIEWFMDTNKDKEFIHRRLPMCPPVVQGTFRNSMIAEARSDLYMILDADEVYDTDSYFNIFYSAEKLEQYYHENGIKYGMVRRIEVCEDLKEAYGVHERVPHHRLYHRTAIFGGPHPGEWPFYKQKDSNQMWIDGPECYHFHNAARSSRDEEVPKRKERKNRKTYHPGKREPINILDRLPILRKRIEDFPVNPELERLQNDIGKMPVWNSD